MVKIITQNVRGLNEKCKRKSIFSHLRDRANVICIQETHLTKNVEQTAELEWGGQCFWSHGSSASKGVGILVDRMTDIEVFRHILRYGRTYSGNTV